VAAFAAGLCAVTLWDAHRRVRDQVVPVVTTPGPAPAEALGAVSTAIQSRADDLAAIRDVIARYGQAIEHNDFESLRALTPSLSDSEKDKAVQSLSATMAKEHLVRIDIDGIELAADRATVRLTRHDEIDGRPLPPFRQKLTLVKRAGRWVINRVGF
jgi:hypothetical protein